MVTESQSEGKKERRSKKQNQAEFENKAMSAMPRWAWAFCAILMAISLSVRQMGLDISSPLNRIMTAHAVRIEKTAGQGRGMEEEFEDLEQKLGRYEKRLRELEHWAHKPNGTPIH